MLVGYARVSTEDQSLDLQMDALKEHGVEKVYSEHITGDDGTAKQCIERGHCGCDEAEKP
jgi:DNA invertase Pin-like site-specific DNA recombinase